MGEGGGGEEKASFKFLSFTSLPFSLPFFPFSPETPDTQATASIFTVSTAILNLFSNLSRRRAHYGFLYFEKITMHL